VRGFSPIASGFTAETDWLLEESGFELMVPLRQRNGNGRAPAPTSIILRENAPLGERLGRYKAESDTKPRRTALAAYFRTATFILEKAFVRGTGSSKPSPSMANPRGRRDGRKHRMRPPDAALKIGSAFGRPSQCSLKGRIECAEEP
jgi:hypothetical protein